MTDPKKEIKKPQPLLGDFFSAKSIPFLLTIGAVVCVTCFAYFNTQSTDPNLHDITRPAPGFETPIAFEEPFLDNSSSKKAEKDATKSLEDTEDFLNQPNPSSNPPLSFAWEKEVKLLQEELSHMHLLLVQKDRTIADLSRELTDTKQSIFTPVALSTPTPTPPANRWHIVQRGETLSEISRLYYGHSNQWQKIYQANSERIADKNHVPAGIKLSIPE